MLPPHYFSGIRLYCYSRSMPPSQINILPSSTAIRLLVTLIKPYRWWPHSTFLHGRQLREDVRRGFWRNGNKYLVLHRQTFIEFYTKIILPSAFLFSSDLWSSHWERGDHAFTLEDFVIFEQSQDGRFPWVSSLCGKLRQPAAGWSFTFTVKTWKRYPFPPLTLAIKRKNHVSKIKQFSQLSTVSHLQADCPWYIYNSKQMHSFWINLP